MEKTQEGFVSRYWPLLLIGGFLVLSAAGPEYLHRKYSRRTSGRSRR